MPRFLTKSRFKLALDCPAKLYYTGKPEYPDAKKDDSFLEALAEGGYQVGALAKCYYPEGIEIQDRGYDIQLQKTFDLLTHDNVVIFEAAFQYQNLFIRADIIEKKGSRINLLEVKSKSFDGTDGNDMLTKKGFLDSKWSEYVYDVAFQKYVITKAYPEFDVHAYLMLADKNAKATVDGLNQKFQLKTVEDDRTIVEIVGDVSKLDIGEDILIRVNIDDIIDKVYKGMDCPTSPDKSFVENIHFFADKYEEDEKIITPIHKDCKKCEYKATTDDELQGKLSGFKECWSKQLGWDNEMFKLPLVLDIWDFRGKQKLMDSGVYLMRDVKEVQIGDITPTSDGKLSRSQRQWLQVRKTVDKDNTPYIDKDGLRAEYNLFTYPLHFIDFETSMVAIPFNKDRRPYEQLAFQFSHHIVTTEHNIEHIGQYLCVEKGMFPNFEFIRSLKSQLEHDQGSIFRYADHENTVLNQILAQLEEITIVDVPDKPELIAFIKNITHGANHQGTRDMIDLLKLVKHYYYHPLMGGSNSLKYVLPAVLKSSEYIQRKYAQPIYGKNSSIKSLNYEDGWIWIKNDENGSVINPYKLLPSLFEGIDEDLIESFLMRSDIQEGGAAMTAYAKMQFARISDIERSNISKDYLGIVNWIHWQWSCYGNTGMI